EKQLKQLFRRYVERKQKQQVLDYDDLLLYWEQLLVDDRMADEVGGRFDHILVDEYQDTNLIQGNILRRMRRKNKNIMVVGDDAQSIYSFRGATVRNILDFPRHFPGTTIITLDQNYRSTMPILRVTNAVISQARERYTKNLWSERKTGQRPVLATCADETYQDTFVADTILKHHEAGIPLHRQAVLFRAGHHSDSLEIELARRQIPFRKYGGLRFLETAHVKDLLGFLKIVENPRDELSWFRVLQLLKGVGPATASEAMKFVWQHGYEPAVLSEFNGPAIVREEIKRLGGLFRQLKELTRQPAAQVELVRRFYQPLLPQLYENAPARQKDLENLEKIASRYKSLTSFLIDLTLEPPTSTSDLAGPADREDDWLVLSTIHSAKGCEWDVVFLIHASDGCLPSDMSADSPEEIEEELRLAYVAMTRARDFLYVSWPLRYYHAW
ncbi:MAG TPA: ATP-dependent helicase, partial [bacterium]|nr:ATP-dependent helicase [bacterium]